MRLYKIYGFLAFASLIVGTASFCEAIENHLKFRYPIGILVFGCVCLYMYFKETGGYIDVEEEE